MKINTANTGKNANGLLSSAQQYPAAQELLEAVLRVVELAAASASQQQEPAPSPAPEQRKLAYTIDEAVEMLSIGRSHLFDLLRRGEIVSCKSGRRRLIPAGSLERYLARLVAEQASETP
ncbi:MAG: helix-turn-helix domain-containing protein [Pseudonocardiaceae bacterium]